MYNQLLQCVFMNSSESLSIVSQAVSTGGMTGATFDLTVIVATGTPSGLTATLEESNDLQRWTPASLTAVNVASYPGYGSSSSLAGTLYYLTKPYVRIKVTFPGTGGPYTAIVSAGVHFLSAT